MNELKPCPFCKDTDVTINSDNNDGIMAYCNGCEASTPYLATLEAVQARWNLRKNIVYPCPCCGSSDIYTRDSYYSCNDCGLMGPELLEWNNRA